MNRMVDTHLKPEEISVKAVMQNATYGVINVLACRPG